MPAATAGERDPIIYPGEPIVKYERGRQQAFCPQTTEDDLPRDWPSPPEGDQR